MIIMPTDITPEVYTEAEARARVLVETRVRRVTAIIEQIGRHATDHLRTLDEEEDES